MSIHDNTSAAPTQRWRALHLWNLTALVLRRAYCHTRYLKISSNIWVESIPEEDD